MATFFNRVKQSNPKKSVTRCVVSVFAFFALTLHSGQFAWGQAAGLLAGGAEKLAPITLSLIHI